MYFLSPLMSMKEMVLTVKSVYKPYIRKWTEKNNLLVYRAIKNNLLILLILQMKKKESISVVVVKESLKQVQNLENITKINKIFRGKKSRVGSE